MHSSLKFPPWCFDQVKVFFFSNSVTDLLLYLGSLSYCTSKFGSSLSCQTDGLKFNFNTLVYRRVYQTTKQPKSSPLHHRAWKISIRFLCWYAVFGFLTLWCYTLYPNSSTLVSSVQRILFKCNFAKPYRHILLRETRFSPGNPAIIFPFLF